MISPVRVALFLIVCALLGLSAAQVAGIFLGWYIAPIVFPSLYPARRFACPLCGSPMIPVLHYGLPHQLCEDRECSYLGGRAANLTAGLPWSGRFLCYDGTRRGYWKALWRFLRWGIKPSP